MVSPFCFVARHPKKTSGRLTSRIPLIAPLQVAEQLELSSTAPATIIYMVATLLTNIHACLRGGNQTSEKYNLAFVTLFHLDPSQVFQAVRSPVRPILVQNTKRLFGIEYSGP